VESRNLPKRSTMVQPLELHCGRVFQFNFPPLHCFMMNVLCANSWQCQKKAFGSLALAVLSGKIEPRTENRSLRYYFNTISCAFSFTQKQSFISMLGKEHRFEFSVAFKPYCWFVGSHATMKSEIVIELLTMMLRKFIKTKIIVCQNVNFMLNLINSYDGSRRRRDRSKRSHHRQSPEQDVKQQRRHRKPLNGEKPEAVRAKVSRFAESN
jgi:hypothetical protein